MNHVKNEIFRYLIIIFVYFMSLLILSAVVWASYFYLVSLGILSEAYVMKMVITFFILMVPSLIFGAFAKTRIDLVRLIVVTLLMSFVIGRFYGGDKILGSHTASLLKFPFLIICYVSGYYWKVYLLNKRNNLTITI